MNDRALVLVTTSFPIVGDGSEAAGSFVSDLAEEVARYVPVRVVAPGPSSMREKWSEGVEVFRYAAPTKPLSTLKPWQPRELAEIVRVLRAGGRATREAVHAGPTAHMLALWALPSGEWARRVSLDTGVPYSAWTLGSDIWSLGRIPIVRSRLRTILRGAEHCWSDGLKLAEDTRVIAGRGVEFLPSTRRVTGQRIHSRRAQPPFRLLFLGRWHPNKGVDLLLEALMLLSNEDWTAIERVDVCGGGPLEEVVHARVIALVAAGRPVCVHGYLDRSAAEAAMLAADWLLIPSRIESIPVVFSDAMKLGLPVVTTPVGDLRELVRDAPSCGEVAEAADEGAFARAISTALQSDPSRYVEGIANRTRHFDLGRIAQAIVKRING